MDDDKEKSVIEKMVDKVNDAVENIVKAAVMPTTEEKPDPKQVTRTMKKSAASLNSWSIKPARSRLLFLAPADFSALESAWCRSTSIS